MHFWYWKHTNIILNERWLQQKQTPIRVLNSIVRSEFWFQTHLFTGSTKSLGVVRNRPAASSPIVFACRAVIFSYSDSARPKLWKSVGKHSYQTCTTSSYMSVSFCISKDKKTRWSPRTRMLTRMLMVQMSKHMVMQSHTIPFCNTLFEQSCTCFPCYQSAVWSGKCRVWSVECEVRSVECKVWSGECRVCKV